MSVAGGYAGIVSPSFAYGDMNSTALDTVQGGRAGRRPKPIFSRAVWLVLIVILLILSLGFSLLIALAGLVVAVMYGVYSALKHFSYYQVLVATPTTKIDSAPYGLAEINAAFQPEGGGYLVAPVSGAKCAFYCATVYEIVGYGNDRGVETHYSAQDGLPSMLADGTGYLIADFTLADLEVNRTTYTVQYMDRQLPTKDANILTDFFEKAVAAKSSVNGKFPDINFSKVRAVAASASMLDRGAEYGSNGVLYVEETAVPIDTRFFALGEVKNIDRDYQGKPLKKMDVDPSYGVFSILPESKDAAIKSLRAITLYDFLGAAVFLFLLVALFNSNLYRSCAFYGGTKNNQTCIALNGTTSSQEYIFFGIKPGAPPSASATAAPIFMAVTRQIVFQGVPQSVGVLTTRDSLFVVNAANLSARHINVTVHQYSYFTSDGYEWGVNISTNATTMPGTYTVYLQSGNVPAALTIVVKEDFALDNPITVSAQSVVLTPGESTAFGAETAFDAIGLMGLGADGINAAEVAVGQDNGTGAYEWDVILNASPTTTEANYTLELYTYDMDSNSTKYYYKNVTVSVGGLRGVVEPSGSGRMSANQSSCGNFTLVEAGTIASVAGTCVWTGGSVDILAAGGNSGAATVSIVGADGTTYFHNTTNARCEQLVGIRDLPAQNYTVDLHSGGGGGACGVAQATLRG